MEEAHPHIVHRLRPTIVAADRIAVVAIVAEAAVAADTTVVVEAAHIAEAPVVVDTPPLVEAMVGTGKKE